VSIPQTLPNSPWDGGQAQFSALSVNGVNITANGLSNPNAGAFVSGSVISDGGDVDTGGHLQSHGPSPTITIAVNTVHGVDPPDAGVTYLLGTDLSGDVYFVYDGGPVFGSNPAITVALANAYPDSGWDVTCTQQLQSSDWGQSDQCNLILVGCSRLATAATAQFNINTIMNYADPFTSLNEYAWDGGQAGTQCLIHYVTTGWSGSAGQ
jgi:hypothetical protein